MTPSPASHASNKEGAAGGCGSCSLSKAVGSFLSASRKHFPKRTELACSCQHLRVRAPVRTSLNILPRWGLAVLRLNNVQKRQSTSSQTSTTRRTLPGSFGPSRCVHTLQHHHEGPQDLDPMGFSLPMDPDQPAQRAPLVPHRRARLCQTTSDRLHDSPHPSLLVHLGARSWRGLQVAIGARIHASSRRKVQPPSYCMRAHAGKKNAGTRYPRGGCEPGHCASEASSSRTPWSRIRIGYVCVQ